MSDRKSHGGERSDYSIAFFDVARSYCVQDFWTATVITTVLYQNRYAPNPLIEVVFELDGKEMGRVLTDKESGQAAYKMRVPKAGVHTARVWLAKAPNIKRLKRVWALTEDDVIVKSIQIPKAGGSTATVAIIERKDEPASTNKAERIINKISKAVGKKFEVGVVEEIGGDSMQACAARDGKVWVTRRLVGELNDDELAFVLSHEIAHIENDDGDRKDKASQALRQGIRASIDRLSELDEKMKSEGSGLIKRTAVVILGTTAVVGGAALSTQAYSRETEREADDRSLEIVRKSGFNPESASEALRKLHGGHTPNTTVFQDITSTHPSPQTRKRGLDEKSKSQKH